MCPIVPMFMCGFERSNFSLPIDSSASWLTSTANPAQTSNPGLSLHLLEPGLDLNPQPIALEERQPMTELSSTSRPPGPLYLLPSTILEPMSGIEPLTP